MQVVYAQEPFPTEVDSSIFLAGPTPRNAGTASWRPVALALLEEMGFDGTVFVPEPRNGLWSDYLRQVEWEAEGLNRTDCILFWIPRDCTLDEAGQARLPGLTTNDEWGMWKGSGKVVLGTPAQAQHVDYQRYYAAKYHVPVFNALNDTVRAAVQCVTPGASRSGDACLIPLHLWQNQAFQEWYVAQKAVGNHLTRARVAWSLQGDDGQPLVWVLDVGVHIGAENRVQDNEVVVGRPDISTVVLWSRAPSLRQTEIVLVKEFRTSVRTVDGYVHALPGGSSKEHGAPLQTAVDELHEETGLMFPMHRFGSLPTRQASVSISSFSATCFSIEVSREEMDHIKMITGSVHGLALDGERTVLEVTTVGQLLDQPMTDWSTLGMVFAALSKAMR